MCCVSQAVLACLGTGMYGAVGSSHVHKTCADTLSFHAEGALGGSHLQDTLSSFERYRLKPKLQAEEQHYLHHFGGSLI